MPLNKVKADVLFTKGVNTKTDNRLTLSSDLITLENRRFLKTGALDKRLGFSEVGVSDVGTASNITNIDALSLYDNKDLVMFANSRLYSYSSALDGWTNKDSALSASVEVESIVRNAQEQTNIDFCYANGVSMFVWDDSETGYLLYSIQDTTSGSFFVKGATLSTNGDSPRCLALGNNLVALYTDGSDLKYLVVGSADPTTTLTSGTMSTSYEDVHSDHVYDVTSIGDTGYVFYKGDTATTMQLLSFDSTGTVRSSDTATATIIDCLALCSYTATNDKAYLTVVYKQTNSLIKAGIYTRNLTVHQAIATLDSTSSTDISKITLAQDGEEDSAIVFFQTDGSPASDTLIRTNTIDLDGTVGTTSVFMRSVGIASRAFRNNTNTTLLNVLHESDLQATVFTVNTDGEVVTVIAKGNAGSHSSLWAPTSVYVLASNEYAFPLNVKGRIRSENATLFSLEGISLAKLDFTGPNIYNSRNLNKTLYSVGGLLLSYDGQHVTEQGFHLFPEGIAQSGTAGSGGSMSDGTYQYVALYRWVDNQGNVHNSAPSTPISYTVSGGGSAQTVDIDVPTLRVTQKTGTRGECTIELYRTEDNGTIFYKVTSVSSPEYNDPTADAVTITDTVSDASLVSNEILYTTGGVLDNIGAPSCDIVTSHQNRLFIAGLENKNEIRYTKIVRNGEGIAFNEALSIPVDPRGGAITQLASMDANLVVFKRDNLYRIVGDGPSDTGSGATFTDPELIASDVGCVDPNSVVLGPAGLYFKSAKGIYLLDRTLSTSYIGAAVEAYNDETITSAVLIDDVNEIRFSTSGGNILVYNYFFNQWSVTTGHTLDDALVYDGNYYFITSSDTIRKEDSGYKDADAFVNSKISTGWIRVGEMQGYQRAYRLGILGEFRSKHLLKVSIYNDYGPVPVQEKIFDVNSILSVDDGFYGDEIYGAIDTYGTSDVGVYQFLLHLKKQKCQAFRVVIEDIFDNSDNDGSGEGASIVGLTIEVGVKAGLNKVKTGRQG